MQSFKRYLPLIAVVLLALGLNLDRFGIDLESIAGSSPNPSGTRSAPASPEADGSAQLDPDGALAELLGKDSAATAAPNRDPGPHWSTTQPNINLWHIFEGEINSRGKPVGFHSRPGGQDPAGARLVSINDAPNGLGVYTATIEIRDGNVWKRKFSSFFPDTLSRDDVIDSILHAYANSDNPEAQPWEGDSGLGFRIQGYTTSRGGINTAYPIFTRR